MKSSEKYILNNPWYLSHHSAKVRCGIRNGSYSYIIKGIKYLMTIKEVKELWFRDKAGLMKIPVLHRKNNNLDYCFDNCIFIEKSTHDNMHRQQNMKYRQLYSPGKWC